MVTDFFGAILQELAKSLQISELHPDRNNSCLIKFPSQLAIQLEIDRSGRFLIIGSDLGDVPPGKYRENLFREALKANGLPPPLHGILSYSRKTNHLVLFEKLNIMNLNGEKVAAHLAPFIEKANIWKEALQRNEIPVIQQAYTSAASTGMFGLRP